MQPIVRGIQGLMALASRLSMGSCGVTVLPDDDEAAEFGLSSSSRIASAWGSSGARMPTMACSIPPMRCSTRCSNVSILDCSIAIAPKISAAMLSCL